MQPTPAGLGRFRIERELGSGAMGVVYRAFDPVVERPVAIKAIRSGAGSDSEFASRLLREARAVGSLEHPNIVTLFDAGESNGVLYLVMQLVEGETLRGRIDRQHEFDRREILGVFRQLLMALSYAHARGIVHRDVKPANVLITPEGTVKLTDFGVARFTHPGMSSMGLIVGTPSYMAPEQMLGHTVDLRADVYAAGCILYEMVMGRKPFAADSTAEVICQVLHAAPAIDRPVTSALPAALDSILLRALAKDPSQRFSSCSELLSALEDCLDGAPMGKTETGSSSQPRGLYLGLRELIGRSSVALATGILFLLCICPPAVVVLRSSIHFPPSRFEQPRSSPESNLALQRQPVAVFPPASGRPSDPRVGRAVPAEQIPSKGPASKGLPAAPPNFSSLMVYGDLAFQRNRYAEALRLYQRALQVRPGDRGVRRKVAVTLALLGRPESARPYQ